jgi:hypothetical protein
MLFFLRFSYVALLLIFTPLFFPGFEPGAKPEILIEAMAAAFFTQWIRRLIGERFAVKGRGWLAGTGFLFGLAAAEALLAGVKWDWAGVIVVYLGVVALETVLPFRIGRKARDDEQEA